MRFFSLQKGGVPAPASFHLIDYMDEMNDFADTAALIANLDLVVSVDTAVAHLAGALGKPVWLLDRFDHCWRWLAGRLDSPWYPTLRIYRQPSPGNWDAVLKEVARDLQRLVTVSRQRQRDGEPPQGAHDPHGKKRRAVTRPGRHAGDMPRLRDATGRRRSAEQ